MTAVLPFALSVAKGASIAGGVAGSAVGGSTAFSVLQGGATILSAANAIRSGNEDARSLELRAADAQHEKALENLQGISRRTSIKRELAATAGDIVVANAASGLDNSFGTARLQRKQAFDDADRALASDALTQNSRISRLEQRRLELLRSASRTRRGGRAKALFKGLSFGASVLQRG